MRIQSIDLDKKELLLYNLMSLEWKHSDTISNSFETTLNGKRLILRKERIYTSEGNPAEKLLGISEQKIEEAYLVKISKKDGWSTTDLLEIRSGQYSVAIDYLLQDLYSIVCNTLEEQTLNNLLKR